ncbi:hypothetical protein PPTG_23526 [Phytophthora nicotianae INRA-310]|uniref:Uncharacterized protein n=1 Tax=Phytophthora nicotianae (strain INRA-310) TaxID=761204 RepID=W2PXK0_PHYN3|nr:hypothetical protein PPTG_23526 [Phytophthora nicotianae INRA-310]ETN04984.1 hypothetical protein PPTG_23526 [Phytophthora nicotianae INRA-310]
MFERSTVDAKRYVACVTITPVKNAPVTSAAEELEKKDQAFEEKDAVTV